MSDIVNTVFNNISPENENSVTEILASLFRKEKFRKILFNFFQIKDNDAETFVIETQQNYGDNGRPDLIIKSTNTRIFIENKIFDKTSLTNNQPKGYLEELSKASEKNKKLIFLIPKNYFYRPKLNKRIREYSEIRLCEIKNWSDLIDVLKKENKKFDSDLLSDCIVYFENIVDKPVEETTILSEEEFKLLKKVDKIYKYLNKITEDYLKCSFYKPKKWFCEYGIGSSYTLDNCKELFVGISPYSHYQYSFAIWSQVKYYESFLINGKRYVPHYDNKKDNGGYWTYYELKYSDFEDKSGLANLIKDVIQKLK